MPQGAAIVNDNLSQTWQVILKKCRAFFYLDLYHRASPLVNKNAIENAVFVVFAFSVITPVSSDSVNFKELLVESWEPGWFACAQLGDDWGFDPVFSYLPTSKVSEFSN